MHLSEEFGYTVKEIKKDGFNIARAVLRFGNIKQTSGNVFEIWQNQLKTGQPLTVTHPEATRYFMDMDEAVNSIIEATTYASGGEIFVSDMREYNILDLAQKLPDDSSITGLRADEKLHEQLLSEEERKRAKRFGDKYWVIK